MTVPTPFPGVPVAETSGQVRSIAGVATSITAFVGSASRGPVGTPTIVRDQIEFVRMFGQPTAGHALGHLVRGFFGKPAARDQILGAHEDLPHQHRVDADGGQPLYVLASADATLTHQ